MSEGCKHERFNACVNVIRLTESEGGPVIGFTADVTITCECGVRMQFLGLEPGQDLHGARVSLDGFEARLALSPEGVIPNPFQRIAYNITAHN